MSDVYNIKSRIERLGRSIAFLLIICLCVFAVRNVVKVSCAKIELFEVSFVGDAISDLASFFPIMLLALSFLHCICVGYRIGRGYIVSSFAAFTWHLSCQLFHSEIKSGIISVLCFSHGILLVSLVYAAVMIAALICVVFRVRHYCILAMLAVLFIILMFAVFDTKPPQGGQSSPPVINRKAPQPLRHKLTSSPSERIAASRISSEGKANLLESEEMVLHATSIAERASEKNQIMDELLNQPQIPSDYGDVMIGLYRDKSPDPASRSMAVQLCGERRVRSSRPALEAIGGDSASPAVLRISAIRALALIDGKESRWQRRTFGVSTRAVQ